MKRFLWWLLAIVALGGILTGAVFYLLSQHPITKNLPPQPFHLLILGDSIAQGVGSVDNDNSLETYLTETLKPNYSEFTVENKAVPGSKTEEVLNDQLTKLQRDHYSATL